MIHIEGYAVVCEADCIADADGKMPEFLKTEAEWQFFQQSLDRCEVVVLGRRSHDMTPNPKGRRRLVMTAGIKDVDQTDERTVFWNPAGATLQNALEPFETNVARLGVTGGQRVFDWFLTGPDRFHVFHLSRIRGAELIGGTPVFSKISLEKRAENVLSEAGFQPGDTRALDAHATVAPWVRAGWKFIEKQSMARPATL
ncbi:MAG: hypothetical protein AAGJ29_02215 [Pseudomonadota bacterium]